SERELGQDLQRFGEGLVVACPARSPETMRRPAAFDTGRVRPRLQLICDYEATAFTVLASADDADREALSGLFASDGLGNLIDGGDTRPAPTPDGVACSHLKFVKGALRG